MFSLYSVSRVRVSRSSVPRSAFRIPRFCDLLPVEKRAEHDRAVDRSLHDLFRNSGRPIRAGQPRVHAVDVDSRRVGGDLDLAKHPLASSDEVPDA
jgi:hypothetical protein